MTVNLRGFKASKVVCITVLLLMSILAALVPSVSAGDWTKKDLGNIGGTVNAVAIGDANNDGEPEVYAASSNGGAFMLKQNPKDPVNWMTMSMGYGEGSGFGMTGIVVGDGRNIYRKSVV